MSAWVKQKQSGFTIVELLIVIVVIAILATISVVAYRGVQQRARNVRVAAGVEQYVKAIKSYHIVHSSYPTHTGCLGANYPDDVCWKHDGFSHLAVSASLDAQLNEFIPQKPTLATALMDLGVYTPARYQRAGLSYRYTDPANIELRYYLEGLNRSCISGFTFSNEGYLSRCTMMLAN